MISSRPAVASQVRHLFNKSVEVLGFGDDQINEYIQAKYSEDKSFSKYLDGHPHIKHTCYIPLHLAMLVYLKDNLLDMPETETEVYEQFIIHTLNRDFCKSLTSSCSLRITLPTSLNDINKLPEVESLLFHIANLSYVGIQKRQSIFTKVEPVLQHTKSSLLVVDKMSVLQPTTYSFPHLTIQEFLAAFYFNTYLSQQEQKRVLAEYSKQQTRYFFWTFCCGLKRNENQTIFFEFFNLLYQYNNRSKLPFYCAHEAQSLFASQQLISFTTGIAELGLRSYYDAASVAFVAVSAAQNLPVIAILFSERFSRLFLQKLCGVTTSYSQLRKVKLHWIHPSNIGCLLRKSPNLESLSVNGLDLNLNKLQSNGLDLKLNKLQSNCLDSKWNKLQSEDVAALVLPPYGTKLLNMRHISLDNLNIGDNGVEKLSQLLQDSRFLEKLSLAHNGITDNGASAIANLIKTLPHLQHVYLDGNHIGDKGVEKLSQLLQQVIFLKTLSLNHNGIGDNGASSVANLIKTLPRLQHVYLAGNHIGGTGAALLWKQSILKCCNLHLDWNMIGSDSPDAFISALSGTENNGYERDKSCQLKVIVSYNGLLCSDLSTIRTKLPKRVMLDTAGDYCVEPTDTTLNRSEYYVSNNFLPSFRDSLPFSFSHLEQKAGKKYYKVLFQWIFYFVCIFFIFHSTRTKRWGLLYFFCCLTFFILSSYNYLVQVDYFILIVSFLGSLIVAGRLIFHVSLKLLSKQWAGLLSSQ